MIRLLFAALLALSLLGQNPNTAQFGTAVATDQYLLAAKRLSESSLNGSINASTTTVVVSDGTQFLNWQIIRIDSEEMLIQSISSNTLTIVSGGRGYNGTTAASHTTGAAVRGIITSWHHNQLAAEVKAIETRLRNVTGQCQDAGSTDDYACSPAPPFTAYATGMIVNFKAATANTGAATVNFNSIGAGAIKKVAGGVTTALDTNDIRAGQWVTVVYDGTNFQMISALGNAGSSSGSGISSCVPSGASGTAYTCTPSPAVSSYTTGLALAFKPDVASSGSATLNVNSLGTVTLAILSMDGNLTTLSSGTIQGGIEYLAIYDGTYFVVIGTTSVHVNQIADEGSNLTKRAILNFVGNGVSCVDNSGSSRTDCTIFSPSTVQAGTPMWCRSTTGNDTYTCALTPTLTAYTRGGCLVLDADTANTGTATVNVDTVGAKSILNRAGGALATGDITANAPIHICYDGTQYIIQGDGAGSSSGAPTNAQYLTLATDATLTNERVLTPDTNMSVTDAGAGGAYTFGPDTAKILSRATAQAGALRCAAADADDAYDCNMTPTLTAYTDGMVVEFEATVTANTGAATLQIDTLAGGGKAIKLCDGTTDPATGDIAVGKQIPLRYDGTVFRLPCNPATVSGGGATTYTKRIYINAAAYDKNGSHDLGGALGATAAQNTSGVGTYIGAVLNFPDTAQNGVTTQLSLDDWAGSGNISVKIFWSWGGGGGSNGVWREAVGSYCVTPNSDEANPSLAGMNVVEGTSSSVTGSADRVWADSLNASTTGCAAGDVLLLHFYRDAADAADATTGSVQIWGFQVSYTANL